MITFLGKLILCLMPILLTPVWGYLIVEDYLEFGCGKKDILLLLPWMVWTFIYSVIFIVFWVKWKKIKVILLYSIGGATGILGLTWLVLYIWFNELLGMFKG